MKRFHVHLSVQDIEQSARFYSALFGAEPSVRHSDYAKWMLDNPRVNFAISQAGGAPGVDHLGFQVDTADELHAVTDALKEAGLEVLDEGETTCCYAHSEKGWVRDPQGIAWESFVTHGESVRYRANCAPRAEATASCCAPAQQR
jgi:catechol 2,3-dioxygenase-like lactoylglutathione lyase family enzyme